VSFSWNLICISLTVYRPVIVALDTLILRVLVVAENDTLSGISPKTLE